MLPDRVSNPGNLTYESGALPIALRGPARVVCMLYLKDYLGVHARVCFCFLFFLHFVSVLLLRIKGVLMLYPRRARERAPPRHVRVAF